MWHEARKQEKKIRGMLVDYKKRAERRKEYYERIKQDPTQFIQIHGRACKIHLDPAIHYAAEAPGSMMPWRGDNDSMIDRFDVRAHLDDIPAFDRNTVQTFTPEQMWEERQANYERYRILVQNEFLAVKEEKFLNQIRLEELYGPVGSKVMEDEKKALLPKKAAIGFVYEEPPVGDPSQWPLGSGWASGVHPPLDETEDDSADDTDSDLDLDLTVDVLSLSNHQQKELNLSGVEYGLNPQDFMDLMSKDLEEAEALRIVKEHEDEKAMYSGRKSRKERRALKKKHLDRKFSPPSYAARSSPTYGPYQRLSSRSHSRSPSPLCGTSQIKFITSFGEDSEAEAGISDGDAGVIIIPEAEGSSKATGGADRRRKCSSSSLSSSRRSKQCRRPSSSSRERSQSISRISQRRRRSSSRRRSRSKSPRSNRRERDYPSYSTRYRRRFSRSHSRSRSHSADRSLRKIRHGNRVNSASRSYSHSRSRSRSRSRSGVTRKVQQLSYKGKKTTPSQFPLDPLRDSPPPKLPSPPRRRYYGRRTERSDSEGPISGEDDGDLRESSASPLPLNPIDESPASFSLNASSAFGNDSSADKSGAKLTPKERLRKKMQALLKKQYKADKKLEKERAVKAEQERQDREEELREIAIKLRRRERERRHRLHGDDSNSEDSIRSRSPSRSPPKVVRLRGREKDSTYERESERELERNRSAKERPRARDVKDTDASKYTNRSRSRERDRDRLKEKGKERNRSREWNSERDARRSRDDEMERLRDDPPRGRDPSRAPTGSDRFARGSHTSSYGESSYGHVRDGRYIYRQSEHRHMSGYSDSYTSGSEGKKVRLVDY